MFRLKNSLPSLEESSGPAARRFTGIPTSQEMECTGMKGQIVTRSKSLAFPAPDGRSKIECYIANGMKVACLEL